MVDILAPVEDAFLSNYGFVKGARLVSKRPILQGLMTKLQGQYQIVPGGSACNTIIGLANLGMETAFAGKCGKDHLGALLTQSLNQNGVSTYMATVNQPTGTCLSLITPDSERTMLVDLAAANTLTAEDIPADFFNDAGIAHFEGYMVENRDLTLNLLDRAYDAGCLIALDLGSFTVVRAHHDFIRQIVHDYVDVLIGNESEGMVYTETVGDEDIVKTMAQNVDIAVLKNGVRGSLIHADGKTVTINAASNPTRPVIDTTGAGDLWNSGFLYGVATGMDLQAAGELASLCGYEVCCTTGAQIEPNGWQSIQNYMSETIIV